MKIKKLLLSCLFTCMISITSFAQDYGPGYSLTNVENDDCEYCREIKNLYQNEGNITLKTIEIETLRSMIHPENYRRYTNATLICKVPYSEKIFYELPTCGFSQNQLCYEMDINKNELYVYQYNVDININDYKNSIKNLDQFIQEIKQNTINMNDYEKINYFQTYLNNLLEYDTTNGIIYKADEVLKQHQAVCTGYSTLFYLCCINTGIKCECVGNKIHMWNRVWLDNSWKYIDTTWNDQAGENRWYLLDGNELDDNHILLDCFKDL